MKYKIMLWAIIGGLYAVVSQFLFSYVYFVPFWPALAVSMLLNLLTKLPALFNGPDIMKIEGIEQIGYVIYFLAWVLIGLLIGYALEKKRKVEQTGKISKFYVWLYSAVGLISGIGLGGNSTTPISFLIYIFICTLIGFVIGFFITYSRKIKGAEEINNIKNINKPSIWIGCIVGLLFGLNYGLSRGIISLIISTVIFSIIGALIGMFIGKFVKIKEKHE